MLRAVLGSLKGAGNPGEKVAQRTAQLGSSRQPLWASLGMPSAILNATLPARARLRAIVQCLEGSTLKTLYAILEHTVEHLNKAILRWIINGRVNVFTSMCIYEVSEFRGDKLQTVVRDLLVRVAIATKQLFEPVDQLG